MEEPASSALLFFFRGIVTSASSPSAPSASPSGGAGEHRQVEAQHITFDLPAEWTMQSGEESFAFQSKGATVGGLDGLGFSDTIDGLLPNGAVVESQTELKGTPVKAVEAKLTLDDDGQSEQGKRQELHYFFFLADEKIVYDLHFDAGQVNEEAAKRIVRSAAVH